MNKVYILLLTVLSFLVFFPNRLPVYSQEKISDLVVFEKVNPDNTRTYKLKRLKEKVILMLQLDSKKKANYMANLLDKRLAELAYTVDKKDIANIETVSQRYEASAGVLSKLVIERSLIKEKNELIVKFETNLEILEVLSKTFPYESAEFRLVMNDINSTKIYLDQIKK